jgi:hypothetical protein
VTGIARSVNPGQNLRNIKPVNSQINDTQVFRQFFFYIFKIYNIYLNQKHKRTT